METQELHRGRLIDHIQLVVKDLAASMNFYSNVLGALNVPMGGSGETHCRICSNHVPVRTGVPRHGLACEAKPSSSVCLQ